MLYSFDPVLLARTQFAFTVSAHIFFPDFSIGLGNVWRLVTSTRGVTDGVTGRDSASIVGAETS